LEDYDQKLLSEAKRKQDATREKDLKRHMVNKDPDEKKEESKSFEVDELVNLEKKREGKSPSKDSGKDAEMEPLRFDAKEDYQVRQAINYLKSYDLFKKIATFETPTGRAPVAEVSGK
jgi:carboxyl-terminal processing protease